MKTKIRTFIGLVALGMIGITSNNVLGANSLMSSMMTVETKTLKAEKAESEKTLEALTEENFFKDAEIYTALGSDKEIEKYAVRQIESSAGNVETENYLGADNAFLKAAEFYTASGADKEIEKYADKQVALENERK